MNTTLTFVLDHQTKHRLRVHAALMGKTMSELVRDLVEEGVFELEKKTKVPGVPPKEWGEDDSNGHPDVWRAETTPRQREEEFPT